MNDWELSHSYDYHGRQVRYGRLGEGPPMVLVHGTPWSSFNLRHLIRKLFESYTVYFFDLLGYGQSCTTEGDVSLGHGFFPPCKPARGCFYGATRLYSRGSRPGLCANRCFQATRRCNTGGNRFTVDG